MTLINPDRPHHDPYMIVKTLIDSELTNDEIDEKEQQQQNNITNLERRLVITTLLVVYKSH